MKANKLLNLTFLNENLRGLLYNFSRNRQTKIL